jgi:hypothetical protein
MSRIELNEKIKVCLIKANRNFVLWLQDSNRYTYKLPESYIDYGRSKYKYILTPEFAWYKIGVYDREYLEKNPSQNPKKDKDILNFHSPTTHQLKWILDLNKCRSFFPQAFWDLEKCTAYLEIAPEDEADFKYKLVPYSRCVCLSQATCLIWTELKQSSMLFNL